MLRLRVPPAFMIVGMLTGSVAAWFVAFSPCQSLWVAPAAFTVSMLIVFMDLVLSSGRNGIVKAGA
jgi:hypothetical protein